MHAGQHTAVLLSGPSTCRQKTQPQSSSVVVPHWVISGHPPAPMPIEQSAAENKYHRESDLRSQGHKRANRGKPAKPRIRDMDLAPNPLDSEPIIVTASSKAVRFSRSPHMPPDRSSSNDGGSKHYRQSRKLSRKSLLYPVLQKSSIGNQTITNLNFQQYILETFVDAAQPAEGSRNRHSRRPKATFRASKLQLDPPLDNHQLALMHAFVTLLTHCSRQ